jgi:hypothetical protein
MVKPRTPRTTKPKAEKSPVERPENGNGVSRISLEEEIRVRAYELYEQRGRTPGFEQQDWLNAEREVLARHTSSSHAA